MAGGGRAADTPELPVTDAHVHAWPGSRSGPRTLRPGWAELRSALRLGRLAGRVVLVTPGSPPGDDAWTLQVARREGAAVRAVLRSSALTLARTEPGCGVRLVLEADRTRLCEPVVEAAAEAALPISLQNATGEWAAVAAWAERYPSATFLVDHMGHPDPRLGTGSQGWKVFLDLAAFPNVVVKMANLAHFTQGFEHHGALRPFVHSVMSVYGTRRLLWASDWPNTGSVPYAKLVRAAVNLVEEIDEHAVARVFRRNADRLLWGSGGSEEVVG